MSVKYIDKNGNIINASGLTPGGNLEAGAVATRQGRTEEVTVPSNDYTVLSITFDTPMPDADYDVNLYAVYIPGSAGGDITYSVTDNTTHPKTANGFKIVIFNGNSTNTQVRLSWKAWKTYTVQHAAETAASVAALEAMVPAGAGSGNQLTTKSYVDAADTSLGSRLDDVEDVIDATASITNKLISQSTMQIAIDNVEIDVDDQIDATSENPVQNKVIKAALDNKENKQFTGTQAEWNALTEAQKKSYRIANIIDDTDYVGNLVDTITDGNMSAVTSNAVFDAINNKTVTQITTSLSANFQIINNQHYTQSYIITKGNMCQIDIVIECLNDCSGSQSICVVPTPETLITLCTPPWDKAYQLTFDDQRRESLIQSGVLYINGGKAGTHYALHLNYII